MKVVGITGGIAGGKSHVLSKLKSMGAFVLDCDSMVKELSAPGEPLHKAIACEFGQECLNTDGTIDKRKLRKLVFSDTSQLQRLNSASALVIYDALKERLAQAGDHRLAFVEGVRIFEDEFKNIFDEIWFVCCDEAEQLQRLIKRDGVNEKQAKNILDSQRELMLNRDKADVIIETDGDIADLYKKIEKLYAEMESEKS